MDVTNAGPCPGVRSTVLGIFDIAELEESWRHTLIHGQLMGCAAEWLKGIGKGSADGWLHTVPGDLRTRKAMARYAVHSAVFAIAMEAGMVNTDIPLDQIIDGGIMAAEIVESEHPVEAVLAEMLREKKWQ